MDNSAEDSRAASLKAEADCNVRYFTIFRVFFSARFYYPVYALLFLDYGLTLEQIGILNGVWAATIVLLEVPSGALADTIGRRRLLVLAAICMIFEMLVLLIAPIGGGTWLFTLFLFNRILSGVAEAAASGADEALAYDSLSAAGEKDRWGQVLEQVQKATSLAFFFAMMIGAAVYDAGFLNSAFSFLGLPFEVESQQLIKMPILLTFVSSLIVLYASLRLRECRPPNDRSVSDTVTRSWLQTGKAAKWIFATPLPFAVLLAAMTFDSVIRQFLTLASEYWRVIDLPIASYGLIGAGMSLLGLFVPRIARRLIERKSPRFNYLVTVALIFIGFLGLAQAIPVWGIIPAAFLYASMQLTSFFVSKYMNDAADSERRATVLSFRGLSTNFTYGAVSLLYSGWILILKDGEGAEQADVFVESLQIYPWYFLGTVVLMHAVYFARFRGKAAEAIR